MPDATFNPKLPVVVKRSFLGGGREWKPGDAYPWQADGVREERVATMVRTGYLANAEAPPPRAARKQAERKAAKAKAAPARKTKATTKPTGTRARRSK